ncbi:MAG: hypothetical protein VXY75_00745, partial [Bacteroidota bacterium]|nr:hypothetical protein [Bacteroidota bacterium]
MSVILQHDCFFETVEMSASFDMQKFCSTLKEKGAISTTTANTIDIIFMKGVGFMLQIYNFYKNI